MNQHLGKNRRPLDYASFGREVTFKHRDSASFAIRIFNRTNHLRVKIDTARDILAYGLSRDGHTFGMEQILFGQLVHNRIHTARLVQVFHISATCGGEMAEVGCYCADLVGNIEIQIHAAFVSDGRQMQHTVGGASKCHIHGQRVHQCFFCHNIAGTDILAKKLHHRHTRVLGKLDACRVNSGDRAVSAKSHTERFGKAIHRIGGIHTRA